MRLETLADALRAHPSICGKRAIAQATARLGLSEESLGRPGDDAAILPRDDGGYDLLAGEGFMPRFVAEDPWFAGWCGVMVNLSDIAAMGGRSVALVDQIWAPSANIARPILDGLRSASAAYGVPIVGGHSNLASPDAGLAVTVFGKARHLLSSFDAEPGDVLLAAIDMRGHYRPQFDNFCAALEADPRRLRAQLDCLPRLAEGGLVLAGKDISQGGIAGTALMLAESAAVGIELDVDRIRPPAGTALERWLRTFPSFGFLLSVAPDRVEATRAVFAAEAVEAEVIGRVVEGNAVTFCTASSAATFWDWRTEPYLRSPVRDLVDA
ncbi:sll0787 family AIR synthase-like protein [Jiella sp. MQZ9-1]|uniref:Sll0787 family AIR synthase-like protein n=1 Tax=Jiella flava TaxID=2816857 RepID=A0A939FZ42_9HYPH|nr:sll0787 family AIR synthase-like protein [Jiella flava]MBO0662875.1 sll0787 family AIR synthase-like protein [Jiella flava]MCD2471365.1 sll0787 family AIR synthase-like protein [Jiella flava]